MSYSVALQKVIFQAIMGAAIAGVKSVVDTPKQSPEASDFPYIQIGAANSIPDDVSGSVGTEEYIDLHVWSRTPGQSETKRVLDDLKAVFHAQSLTVSGLTTAYSYVHGWRVFDDPDGFTRHGVLTLKILCHT
ncbi:DUF3168 domain-containing protein [Roseibium sp. RKSG952]|uniref:DUF3168 domain-containing protein n=1 Tax=Roseibium sp. RKSG952 TaxID=2529384 RepID=UPI0012BBE549|nr:DUF3168 domain-containing protein [Roseibium sp. RKSG952]MTH96644.1 DUF3168 domain-containing protein [Roseibium sp. RKSG952]